MSTEAPRDWTTGPAKLVAVVVLGGACLFGLAWSIMTRQPGSARVGVAVSAPPPRDVTPASQTLPPSPIARRVNLNTATAAELELLPGIGPALAQRIVADREYRGPFRSLNDLDRVSGIGPRLIERLRDKVTIE